MGKSPAFQWYPKDFLSDMNVVMMNLEQRGAYITLLSHCWLEGSLPDDSTTLEAICNHPSDWDNIWSAVKPCFDLNGKGQLINRRLEEERTKQEEWREKSRLGGKKSGKSRRRTTLQPPLNDPSTKRELKGNSPTPISSLQSSSPSTISKKKKKRREYPPEFERLWKVHPKGGKIAALKAFEKLNPDVDTWIEKLLAFKKTKQWKEGYAPHLSTWFNQGQFDGEIEEYEDSEEFDEIEYREGIEEEQRLRREGLKKAEEEAMPQQFGEIAKELENKKRREKP